MHDHARLIVTATRNSHYSYRQPTKLSIRGPCPRNVRGIIALRGIGP